MELNLKNKIIGWFSLLSAVLIIVLSLFNGSGALTSGIIFIIALAWFDIFYQSIIKKKNLTRNEWIAVIVLLFITYVIYLFSYLIYIIYYISKLH